MCAAQACSYSTYIVPDFIKFIYYDGIYILIRWYCYSTTLYCNHSNVWIPLNLYVILRCNTV